MNPDAPRRAPLHAALLLLCLLAGVVLRVEGAWWNRYITDPDSGVVAIMAKHMAEGRGWPVFFYGQDYMGSLEPACSALLCRLFGVNAFLVSLGTALIGMLTLPILYRWGRDAGGRVCGLTALALGVVGPSPYFAFQYNPRGGYMVVLVASMLLLWRSARLAERLWRREQVGLAAFLLLGLVAGVGWWTSAIVTAALLTAAMLVMVGARGRPPPAGVGAGLAGFLAGSLPFWIYNASNGWPSLSMILHSGGIPWRRGLGYLWLRYLRLMQSDGHGAVEPLVLALPLLLAAAAILVHVVALLRRRARLNMHLLGILLFLGLSAVLFVRSSFAAMNTARYLIPWVPAVAVLIGFATATLFARWGRLVAALPVLVLLAFQGAEVRAMRDEAARIPGLEQGARDLDALLRGAAVEACYTHFSSYGYNFQLQERVPFTTLRGDRYRPYARAAELAERIAFLDGQGGVSEFMKAGGGSYKVARAGIEQVEFGFQPPPRGRAPIAAAELAAVTDDQGRDALAPLTDLDADTEWIAPLDGDAERSLIVNLAAPRAVRTIRLWCRDARRIPRTFCVQVRAAGSEEWRTAVEPRLVTSFFWSGPRLYNEGVGQRFEIFLPGEEVAAVRILGNSRGQRNPKDWVVGELQLFAAAPEGPAEADHVGELCAWLEAHGTTRLYSDRWVANRVSQALPGRVAVMQEPLAFPDSPLRDDEGMKVPPGTVLAVLESDAAATASALTRAGLAFQDEALGPWRLLTIARSPLSVAGDAVRMPLLWAGFSCFAAFRDDHAGDLLAWAGGQRDRGEPAAAIRESVEAAVRVRPDTLRFARDLVQWLGTSLPDARTESLTALLAAQSSTTVFTDAAFDRGRVELVGISCSTNAVRPGDRLAIDYLWRSKPGADPHRWIVFVHFWLGGVAFQDDHRLLADVPVRADPAEGTASLACVTRTVRIPPDATPGSYALRVGLYRKWGRADVRAAAPVERGAVVLNSIITVLP